VGSPHIGDDIAKAAIAGWASSTAMVGTAEIARM
jgi:hypothetical protein